MIYLLYAASFMFSPFQAILSNLVVMLTTFSFFVVTSLCMAYFDADNNYWDALKASMVATMVLQICCLFMLQVLQFTIAKPLGALAVLSFFGILISLSMLTRLGTQNASITAAACLCGLWVMNLMLKTGTVEMLIGKV